MTINQGALFCFFVTTALCLTLVTVSIPTLPGLDLARLSYDETDTGGISELRVGHLPVSYLHSWH